MYKHILLPVDLHHDSSWRAALPAALNLCKTSGAALHVMMVVPSFGMSIVDQFFPEGYEKEIHAKVLESLHTFVSDNIPDDIQVQHIVGEGDVYESILNIADKVDADLIVLAAQRPELKNYLLGPNAARVVRHAKCSVMVVRG